MCSNDVHGDTKRAYRAGCRCPEAVEAVRTNWRRRRARGFLLRGPKSRDPIVDEIAVERACNGDPVTLTVAERAEAVRLMTAKGMTARQIAERLRMAERTVVRYRTSRGAP